MAATKTPDEQFSEQETVRRRDEVLRRMLNTPPTPHKPKARGAIKRSVRKDKPQG